VRVSIVEWKERLFREPELTPTGRLSELNIVHEDHVMGILRMCLMPSDELEPGRNVHAVW
jgi:hypothetical protein